VFIFNGNNEKEWSFVKLVGIATRKLENLVKDITGTKATFF
jgi:hypothetical protein